jgi:hypothetical protein
MSVQAFPAEQEIKTRIFEPNNTGFLQNFDEQPFEFKHNFTSDHPLFTREKLRELITAPQPARDIYYDQGDVQISDRYETVPQRTKTVEEVYDSLDQSGAWISLKRVEKFPEYNALLQECLDEVQRLTGRTIDPDKTTQNVLIFLTSPHRVTMYHIDPICNFLLQISGEKEMHVFDRNDRDVLHEEELERFWMKDSYAAKYRPEFEDRATIFKLHPGNGVHVPVNNPHWLKNGDNISVSLSISYQYKDARRKNVYQANYYLRKLGLTPKPLGSSEIRDSMKVSAIAATRAVKSTLKGLKPKR